MKSTKLSLINFNDRKNLMVSLIFGLAFFAFVGQIISGFYSAKHIKIIHHPKKMMTHQNSLRASSPPFTTSLFGDYAPAARIRESKLDVHVVGIMFSKKEKDSQVIIRTHNGEEKYYGVGSFLPGGAVIKKISAQDVVVLYNGSFESLSLPKNGLIFDDPAKPLKK